MSDHRRTSPKLTTAAVLALAAALVGALACAPAPQPPPAATPPAADDDGSAPGPGLPPPPPPAVTLPDGFEVTLELAVTPDELAQGLMFRPHLPDGRGMLLIFSEERLPSIWMMNTLVALDLVYLDRTGTVVDVIADAQPCPAEPCPRYVPKGGAQAVLEIPAGSAASHAVIEGATLRFERVPDYPAGG